MRNRIPKSWFDFLISRAIKNVSQRPDSKLSHFRCQTARRSQIMVLWACALHKHRAVITRPLQLSNLSFMLISYLIYHGELGPNIVKHNRRVCRPRCYYVRCCLTSVPTYGRDGLVVTIKVPYPRAGPNVKDWDEGVVASSSEGLAFAVETQW